MAASTLSTAILLPLIVGLVGLLVPARRRMPELLALATTAATFVLTILLFARPPEGPVELALAPGDLGQWLQIRFTVDGLNGWIAIFAALFGVVVAFHSFFFMKDHARRRTYYAGLVLTVGAALGALYSDGVVSFLFFWGLLAVLLYVLVGIDGARAQPAARKAFLIMGGADFLTLLGFVLLVVSAGTGLFSEIAASPLPATGMGAVIILLLLVGALAKAGSMPFHTWIPAAADTTPIPVLAFLPASLDKLLGVYLLARATIYFFELTYPIALVLMIVGGITIVAAVIMALVQKDLKRVLAFSSVSQFGYMALGIGTGVPIGVAGGMFHMLNHALYESCLFLCGGNVEYRTKTTDLTKLGGLAKAMPLTFGAALAAALAISGIPPLNGFVSKWMVYQGTVESATWAAYGTEGGVVNPAWWIFLITAMFGGALTLALYIKVLYSVFLGPKPQDLPEPKEVRWPMAAPVVGLAAVCVFFGVFATVPIGWIQAALPRGAELVEPIGLWSPGMGTGLLILSLLVGALIYWLSTREWLEGTDVFLGGETIEKDDTRVLGTQFYGDMQEMGFLKSMVGRAERGLFDIYRLLERGGTAFVGLFRRLHTGVLTTYLFWVALGMVFLLLALIGGRHVPRG